jgi:hypothetical protein
MKKKLESLKLGSIKELSASAQKNITGGGPNSPCCPRFYNAAACQAYIQGCPGCDHYNC